MLSPYAKNEWITIAVIGLLMTIASVVVGWWWLVFFILPITAALLAFFRDPNRKTPSQRGAMIAPADGRISSIHEVDHFAPFDGPATCIRIFLSVLDVHINRSPCHGHVKSVTHKPGDHKNALNPTSAETNESNLIVLIHPIRRHPLAAVRQVAGLLARTIACGVSEGDVVQRGQRIGIIKLGSTTELYLPADLDPKVAVQQGQAVYAGLTVLATVTGKDLVEEASEPPEPTHKPATTPANPQPAGSTSE
jgi:phosphatidylserine decarboxylase